jgi:signal transduction histidine kinase
MDGNISGADRLHDLFSRVARPFDEPLLLVARDGLIRAGNPAAARHVPAAVPGGRLADCVEDPADRVAEQLARFARSGAFLPGRLRFRDRKGIVRDFRLRGAFLPAANSGDGAILIRLEPQESASQRFLMLNRKLEDLNAEIEEKRRTTEALQAQTLELEEIAQELEYSLENAQLQKDSAEAARRAAEAATRRLELLADAGMIVAGELDEKAALDRIVTLLTTGFADYAIAYLVHEDGDALLRVAAGHRDPARKPLLRELEDVARPALTDDFGVGRVVRTGVASLTTDISDAMLDAVLIDPHHRELIRRLAPASSVILPLHARGTVIGALTLATTRGGLTPYDDADLPLFEELARRAALAVDNARLYRAAVEASRSKSNFLATMSHELRTPLNAIVGFTDLIQAGVGGPVSEVQRQHLERVKLSARHLTVVIEDILSFSRLEAGSERVRIADTDVVTVIDEALAMVRSALEEKGLELTVAADRIRPLHTDAARLRQILLNLLGNAIKFTDGGGITVRAREVADGVAIEVEDTGVGIPPEHLDRVFEPFWQVDQGATRTVGGTGLGLAVTRRLVELLGGTITVASTPGRGSRFTFTLGDRDDA